MKKNMGNLDKTIRIIVAIAIAVLYFMGQISGTTTAILLAVAAIFVLTSFVGTCPLYLPFNISTKKK